MHFTPGSHCLKGGEGWDHCLAKFLLHRYAGEYVFAAARCLCGRARMQEGEDVSLDYRVTPLGWVYDCGLVRNGRTEVAFEVWKSRATANDELRAPGLARVPVAEFKYTDVQRLREDSVSVLLLHNLQCRTENCIACVRARVEREGLREWQADIWALADLEQTVCRGYWAAMAQPGRRRLDFSPPTTRHPGDPSVVIRTDEELEALLVRLARVRTPRAPPPACVPAPAVAVQAPVAKIDTKASGQKRALEAPVDGPVKRLASIFTTPTQPSRTQKLPARGIMKPPVVRKAPPARSEPPPRWGGGGDEGMYYRRSDATLYYKTRTGAIEERGSMTQCV